MPNAIVPDVLQGISFATYSAAQVIAAVRDVFRLPTPESSWIEYKNAVRIEEDHGVVVATTLPADPLEEKARTPAWDASLPVRPASRSRGGVIFPPADDYDVADGSRGQTIRVQRRTEPEIYLFMEGMALRLLYPIPCPELLTLNGQDLVNCNRLDRGEGFSCWVVDNATGVPVYKAAWRLRYLASAGAFKGDLPVPPNPSLG